MPPFKILLLENSSNPLTGLKENLVLLGYQVENLIFHKNIVQKAFDFSPQLVIIDIFTNQEPEIFTLATYFSQKLNTPVIFLTPSLTPFLIEKIKNSYPFTCLPWPLSFDLLKLNIEIAFNKILFNQKEKVNEEKLYDIILGSLATELAKLTKEEFSDYENPSSDYSHQEMIPICSSCKKIRNKQNLWEEIENYIKKELKIKFTHGFCPHCASHFYFKAFGLKENKCKNF